MNLKTKLRVGSLGLRGFAESGGRCWFILAVVAAAMTVGFVQPAWAQTPMGCTANNVQLTISRPFPSVCVGDTIEYTVTITNQGAGACNMTNVTVRFWSPADPPNMGAGNVCGSTNESCILDTGIALNAGSSISYSFPATSACSDLDFVTTMPGTVTAFACIEGTSQTIPGGEEFTAANQISTLVNGNPTAAAGPDDSKCATASGPTTFNLAGSGTNGTPSWQVTTQPAGCTVTLMNANTLTPTASFPAGCTGCATLTLTVTSTAMPPCPPATDTVELCVDPNPTCTIQVTDCPFPRTLTVIPSGGTAIQWGTGTCGACTPLAGETGLSLIVNDPGNYCVTVTNTATTCSGCCDVVVEECGIECRVTAGGVNNAKWAAGQNGAGAAANHYTFGGQAGAPTAAQPQPYGEWTHRQHKGPLGEFTFHAGTASAPDETEIDLVVCSDPPECQPANPGPCKQIDFEGVGSMKNVKTAPPGGCDVEQGTLHWFSVHLEDLGEPGQGGQTNPPGPECPAAGFAGMTGLCSCPDFYRIKIHCTTNPASPVIYEVYGYIKGGNVQIHPPIDGGNRIQANDVVVSPTGGLCAEGVAATMSVTLVGLWLVQWRRRRR